MKTLTMLVAMAVASASSMTAQTANSSNCRSLITSDVQAVVADLSAIAGQAKAQGFPQAMEKLAADLEAILPSLSAPDQVLVEKFVTDLQNAVSSTGPGGTTITAAERIQLTNDLVQLLLSTGMTSAQVDLILSDLMAVTSSLSGISTVQLQADLQKLAADVKACRVN
jgi:hypothetical protein